jgi:hypothetical protein
MEAKAASPARHVRVAALVLIGALVAGPLATHVYWLFGGTWGLYSNGVHDEVAATGTRVVAAVVVVLLVLAVLVVLAHVGWWTQRLVSERMIRALLWALGAFFLLETLAAFTWSRDEWGWWMYGPVSLLIAALALVVAGSGRSRPRVDRRRTLPSHLKGDVAKPAVSPHAPVRTRVVRHVGE